ncbi:hypothetical protein ACLKA7_009222 [Drosophila subpalustris]
MQLFSIVTICLFGLLAVVSADPVAEAANFYIGECIGCNVPNGTQQVGEQGHFVIGKCTDCKDEAELLVVQLNVFHLQIMEQEFHKEMSALETEPAFCEVRRQIL